MSVSRRQFLAATAVAGLAWENTLEAAILTRREPKALEPKPVPAVRPQPWGRPLVGCQLFVWGQYAERSRTPVDQDRIFAGLKDAGYDYAEGNLNVQDPGANAQFSERLRHHGLVPVSLYTGGEFHTVGRASATARRVAEAARVARKSGFEIIVCNADPIGRDKTEAELAIQASALTELGQELKHLGMKLGMHQHTPELRNGAHEFHETFRQTKAAEVGFCIDTHWLYRGGVVPMDALARYGDRVCSWHLRQSRGGIWWEDLNEGDIDYAPIAAFARKKGLPVRFTVELALESGTAITRDPMANHLRSRQWVKRVFKV